jgi:hypothetical protein
MVQSRWRTLGAAGALAAAGVLGTGCGNEATPPPPPGGAGTVQLALDHRVDGDSLRLRALDYVNLAGNRYSVTTLRYYVSDAILKRADGTEVRISRVHYRDAESLATRAWRLEHVPNGEYSELRFTFGLDETKNDTDSLPSTDRNILMRWPDLLGGGYHYMQLEGHFVNSGDSTVSYRTHLGRRWRRPPLDPPDPQPYPHFFQVTLPLAGLNVHDDTWNVELIMNVNGWYTPEVYDLNVYGDYMMENLEAQDKLVHNGRNAFAVGGISRF